MEGKIKKVKGVVGKEAEGNKPTFKRLILYFLDRHR